MNKNKKRILIADDQPEVRELLTRSLNTAEWNVVARQTGREALAYVVEQTDPVDMVILDMDFGSDEPNGLEVLQQLRQQAPDLPVIILTGKGTVDTAVAAMQMGASSEGSGYGLSICSRIIAAHRGSLRVMSQPGAGTVFRIDLPIDFELASEEARISLQGMPTEASRHPIAEEFME